ncbi:HD-GYP domain-containing protein [Tepidimonas charontis]|uniref:Cyclic di-GMP phosphodiesterase response regulator RpfG n=1 Tax=Tepidimonas charontis TaxID=2267262 RepID=A0A554XGX6_9BURK|nr:HD domain-containing phosphohydrolase [Tepidimonas charontis]TSE35068.1 Cyclic di-GMP phosphodiesterase response regulator RpfG [Tepidimonas charontis]
MALILAVDDNTTNLTLIERLLQRVPQAESVALDDPQLALQWCAQHRPDLILLDYMMPSMDGLTFMQRLAALPQRADVPVIMITADLERQVRYRALELGARDFLNKPLDSVEFIARVRNQLALIDAERKLKDRAAWLAEEVAKATADIRRREQETVLRLSRAAEYRDPETGAHLLRMSHYAQLIGRVVGLPPAEQDLLLQASPMHDVGKVGIPDAILLKPGRLDESEFAIMKRHPQIGYDILAGSQAPLLQAAATIALTHHEKFDGSGYPNGLAGQDIPLYGRIVAVADVFDALTSERPYKKAWPMERARAFLQEQSGRHFDPELVQAFLSAWDEVCAIHARYQDDSSEANS